MVVKLDRHLYDVTNVPKLMVNKARICLIIPIQTFDGFSNFQRRVYVSYGIRVPFFDILIELVTLES